MKNLNKEPSKLTQIMLQEKLFFYLEYLKSSSTSDYSRPGDSALNSLEETRSFVLFLPRWGSHKEDLTSYEFVVKLGSSEETIPANDT